MNTVEANPRAASAEAVRVTDTDLTVTLADGRAVSVPLDWYPRLLYATHAQSRNVRLIGNGTGMHWPDIDEDISIAGLLAGKRSRETERSFSRWLQGQEVGEQDLAVDEVADGDHGGPGSVLAVNRHTMIPWVIQALQEAGGRASIKEVCRIIWKHHSKAILAAGDAFYDWSYEVRWSGALLRKQGALLPAEAAEPGIWILNEVRK